MKRRKTLLEKEEILYSSDNFRILNEGNQVIFEIWGYTTLDLAEAVSLLIIHGVGPSDKVWELPTSFFDKNIFSEKSLYWLSGGDSEWITLEHYSDSWFNCLFDFCSKWSKSIEESVEKSNTLSDIRIHFEENLSLLKIYDWAISKGFVR